MAFQITTQQVHLSGTSVVILYYEGGGGSLSLLHFQAQGIFRLTAMAILIARDLGELNSKQYAIVTQFPECVIRLFPYKR